MAKPVPIVLPPPADTVTYSRQELCALLGGVALGTLERYIYEGLRAPGGKRIRLAVLKVPRGRVAPEALVEFVSKVNATTASIDWKRPPVATQKQES